MNIYKSLNQAIKYIEDNIENKIEYKKVAQILGMNEYTAQTAFYVLCNISISDYIRKRRLSNAGCDLFNTNQTVLDTAIKYQYNSGVAFSRAFEKFHGIKPSEVKQNPQGLKVYSRIEFDENVKEKNTIEYSIQEKEELILYGIGKNTNNENIHIDAPKLWEEKLKQYEEKYGHFDYGMTSYDDRFNCEECKYWVLYNKEIPEKEFEKIVIPKGKWIVIKINSQEAKDIQEVTNKFYKEFVPSTNYTLKEIPELEYYHDDITEFMIPIVSD